MSGPNFNFINQFKRSGHAPLPSAKPQPVKEIEWLPGGHFIEKDAAVSWARAGVLVQRPSNVGKSFTFDDAERFFTNFYQAEELKALIKKYPKPPEGPSRFSLKNSIPRGVSDKQPFGDPSIRYLGHRLLSGMPIRRIPTFPTDITIDEYKFIEAWVKSIVGQA